MDKKQEVELLKKLSNANGISGFEEDLHPILEDALADLGTIKKDSILNVFFTRNEHDGNKPLVLLDAHMDEVGFIVQTVCDNGMLKFLPVGGWIAASAAAQKVRVRNNKGEYIPGVIASKPPHFTSAEDRNKAPEIKDMRIDIGASSADEVRDVFGIDVASPVVPDVEFVELPQKEDYYLAKAFDCRIGCAVEVVSLHKLAKVDLDVDVMGLFSTQEEVGTRGIKVAVNQVKPDLAICFEGAPADDSFASKEDMQTALEKGPMLRHFDTTMITNPKFQRYALDLAKKNNIPVQHAVRSGGGTNGAVLHLADTGIPTIVIGVPVRYIHSHHGIACYHDYKAASDLAVAIVKDLTKEKVEEFTF